MSKDFTKESLSVNKIKPSRIDPKWVEALLEQMDIVQTSYNAQAEDKDKIEIDLGLIDPKFIAEMGCILAVGAKKYSADNWKKCHDYKLYVDALQRHMLKFQSGQNIDPDDNLFHIVKVGVNSMFLYWMYCCNKIKEIKDGN